MFENPYAKMQALVVDDFESFRITLSKMLQEFGIGTVDSVPSGSEALRYCNSKTYDLILCDQNLGKGKTGQQVLEVLRHKPNLNSDSLFLLVSAESNKSIIMAAYDYEPDAYLTKPITGQILGQRLDRLFKQRIALTPIYRALKDKQLQSVVELCEKELNSTRRYAGACQKILGRTLLALGEYEKAETLYRDILEVRQLDWAMLGMAQVKKLQGDSLSAQQWLEEVIQFNSLCLKAYDMNADLLSARGDYQNQQKVLQQAVDVSPLSILRQQLLGDVSFKNNDLLAAANAYRKAVKLGENSVHDDIKFHESFVHASIRLSRLDKNLASPFLRDALKVAAEIPVRFGKTNSNKIAAELLESQLFSAAGEDKRATDCLVNARKSMDSDDTVNLELRIELVRALRELGKEEESTKIIAELLDEYEDEEEQLQKIDCLLDEPCSAKNKALVARINKDGIAFYEAADFNRAVNCFASAMQDFPQHIGLHLNLVQALMGQAKQVSDSEQIIINMQKTMDYIRNIIPDKHAQYRRFRQLDDAIRGLVSAERY